MQCWGASHTSTATGEGGLVISLRFSTTAWMELRSSSPTTYCRWLRIYGKVASRCPSRRRSGRAHDVPYASFANLIAPLQHSSTTSRALHRRKTSPTKSAFASVGSFAFGKCQGELKVSVSARCCSAITRREIRWSRVSEKPTGPQRQEGTNVLISIACS